jgi:hypothetical protein
VTSPEVTHQGGEVTRPVTLATKAEHVQSLAAASRELVEEMRFWMWEEHPLWNTERWRIFRKALAEAERK